jgi:hypothetical protein
MPIKPTSDVWYRAAEIRNKTIVADDSSARWIIGPGVKRAIFQSAESLTMKSPDLPRLTGDGMTFLGLLCEERMDLEPGTLILVAAETKVELV